MRHYFTAPMNSSVSFDRIQKADCSSGEYTVESGGKGRATYSILILTTNTREFDAAEQHIQSCQRTKLKGHDGTDLPFKVRVGTFEGSSMVLVCSLQSGNQRIQSAMHAALYQYHPALVILIGVGGGIGDGISLGSVVVGSHIADYTYSEERGDSVTYKVKGGPVDRSLVEIATDVTDEKSWIERIKAPHVVSLEELAQNAVVGTIGAGNVLITSDTGETAKTLKKLGIHTVEMESAGCYDLSITSKVRFIAIRGISDRLTDKDPKSDEYRQPWAAAHASAVAFEFIDKFIKESKQAVRNILMNAVVGSTDVVQSSSKLLPVSDVPLPPRRASRNALIMQLMENSRGKACLWLYGASGLGKTTLALMIASEFNRPSVFVDLRRCSVEETKALLSTSMALLAQSDVGGLIIDEFPVKHSSELLLLLLQLVSRAQSTKSTVIITSSQAPTPEIESRIGEDFGLFSLVPNLSEADVEELVSQAGGDVSIWPRAIHAFSGGGHPQLVDAKILGLSRRGWPLEELIPLQESAEVLAQHDAAYQRLMNEISADARRLLYRLSLCIGAFDREIIFAIAGANPPIDLPGEQLQDLLGPWVEGKGNSQFIVSPLVKNAGADKLTKQEQSNSRSSVILDLVQRRPFPAEQVAQLLFISLIEQSALGLSWFAGLMLQQMLSDDELFVLLAEHVSVLAAFRADRPLFHADPFLSALLRIVQFFVASAIGSGKTGDIFDSAVQECRALSDKTLSAGLLITLTVKSLSRRGASLVDSRQWLPLIAEFPRLLAESGELGSSLRNLPVRDPEADENPGGFGYDTPEQFLFTANATAIETIDGLVELFETLDQLSTEDRTHLLSGLDCDFPGTRLMISSPWSKQAKARTIDGYAAAKQYEQLAEMAQKWKQPAVEIQCRCAEIVMLDEYADDAKQALLIAELAIGALGPADDLLRRKQVVYFRQGNHEESLKCRPPEVPSIPHDTEHVYGLRDAAISAGKMGEPDLARALFEQSAEFSKQHASTMPHLPAGFLGDCAIIEFERGNYVEALQLARSAVEENEKTLDPKSKQGIFCSAILEQLAKSMWEASRQEPADRKIVGIEAGLCGNPFPSPEIINLGQRTPLSTWYMLALAEIELGVDAGLLTGLRNRTKSVHQNAFEFLTFLALLAKSCKEQNLAEFMSVVPHYLSAALPSDRMQIESALTLSEGQLSPVPADMWTDSEHISYLCEAILAFSLSAVLTNRESNIPDLVHELRTVLPKHDAIDDMLELLISHPKELIVEGIVKTIACCIALCKEGIATISPTQVLHVNYCLWSWIVRSRIGEYYERPLADLMSQAWRRVVTDCRAMMSCPNLRVPTIESVLNGDDRGVVRLAELALAGDGAVSSQLTVEVRRELEQFIASRRKA